MKRLFCSLLIILLLFVMVSCNNAASNNNNNSNDNSEFVRKDIEPDEFSTDTMAQLPNGYHLVWADEFNYNGSPDSAKWNYEVGGGGWGNGESQNYTSRDDNSYVSDGHLTITAKKENYGGNPYTSARLTSKLKGDFKYGFIEFKAILPKAKGTWPALWMMPTDSVYGGWPNSGEIDIMESTGYNKVNILGTTHTNVSQGGGAGGQTAVSNCTTDWNLYQLEWTEDYVKFLVNNKAYYTYNKTSTMDWKKWPFDQRFFLIMNIAMGGSLGGEVDSNFVEDKMLVDYVRVYSKVDSNDNEKPSKPVIKNYSAGYNSIKLSWDPTSDNQGIKQYDIVVNNKQIGATVSNSYVIKDLDEATTYQVRLIAVDYNNNWTISDTVSINTLSELKLPGKVYGYAYGDSEKSVNIISGSDTGGGNVLQIPTNCAVSYRAKSTKSGEYNLKLRLAIQVACSIKVEVLNGTNVIYSETKSVSSSFGKYQDLAFSEKLNLPSGDVTLKITCTASTTGNAILLNYLNIE